MLIQFRILKSFLNILLLLLLLLLLLGLCVASQYQWQFNIYSFVIQKWFKKFWNYYYFHHLLLYCDMNNEIIQSIAYDNYDDFQHVNFIFSQNFSSLLWGLFNDETNLRVRNSYSYRYAPNCPRLMIF